MKNTDRSKKNFFKGSIHIIYILSNEETKLEITER